MGDAGKRAEIIGKLRLVVDFFARISPTISSVMPTTATEPLMMPGSPGFGVAVPRQDPQQSGQ